MLSSSRMDISFRMLEQNELPLILDMMKELNPEVSKEVLGLRLDEMIKEGYECVGAFNESLKLIGVCGVWTTTRFYSGKFMEPDNVFIKPLYRSKGIGERLIAFINDLALERGCESVELNCYLDNEKGRRFWEKEGFMPIGYHYYKKV